VAVVTLPAGTGAAQPSRPGLVVLVCGDRRWDDADAIRRALMDLHNPGIALLVHGGCRGADTLADEVAVSLGIPVRVFPAEWGRYGRAAGPIRNRRMLEHTRPDLVLAFHPDLSRSKGTVDMVRRARAAGVPVRVYSAYGVGESR
jgi:hypothetical protein